MRIINWTTRLVAVWAVFAAFAGPFTWKSEGAESFTPPPPATRIPVHDPAMIRHRGAFYLFATGRGIAVWSSPDMEHWKREKPVFALPPAWTTEAVPAFRGYFWAPDISCHDGRYYLYYSVSAFGKNMSCIGVAVNATLDPADPRFQWQDCGKVIQSYPGISNWNGIDPNLTTDSTGTPYLVFGSFWGGLHIAKLTPDRLALAEDPDHLLLVASRKADPKPAEASASGGSLLDAGDNAIEAPFVFKHEGYAYLFASIDYCCRGARSNYKMIVGRSKEVTGPYLDRAGIPLARGGGTLLLAGDRDWPGVGHNAVCTSDGVDYLVFHGYDRGDQGRAKLRIERLAWDAGGWPVVLTKPRESELREMD